jgi:hypothetical protein
MPRNQKLTKVIAGRTIKAATTETCGVLVVFDDQSNMKIKTAGPATIPPEGKVKLVHESRADFREATMLEEIGSRSNQRPFVRASRVPSTIVEQAHAPG